MALANIKTIRAHRLYVGGRTFYKDRFVVVSDAELIAKLKKDSSFRVVDLSVAEVSKAPEPKTDFMDFKEPEKKKELKYHELMVMNKASLYDMAYEMGADVKEEDKKRDLVKAILTKQGKRDEEISSKTDAL